MANALARDFLSPWLRLFLSVDLVGSTALKQASGLPMSPPTDDQKLSDLTPKWLAELAGFYSAIQVKFAKFIRDYNENIPAETGWPSVGEASLWKVNGDELIYVADLTSAREGVALLYVWLETARDYRKELQQKGSPLDVKLAAWTAGFPIHNIEVIFSDDNFSTNSYLRSLAEQRAPEEFNYFLLERWYSGDADKCKGLRRDFVGPSLDIGFRLASKASPRKFVVNLELAFFWAKAGQLLNGKHLHLFFDGLQDLKGVFGNRPYPIFWLDVFHDHPATNALNVISCTTPLEPTKTLQFCEAFIGDNSKFIFRPFIAYDDDKSIGIMPEHHKSRLDKIKKEWVVMKESFEIFTNSMEGREFNMNPSNVEQTTEIENFKVLKDEVKEASGD